MYSLYYQENQSGRIITLSSLAHYFGKIHWDDLNVRKNYTGFSAYAQSKLMNAIFSVELSRRLRSEFFLFAQDNGIGFIPFFHL